MAIKISFCNRKGGIGKTSSSLAVYSQLKDLGYRTLMCDTDPQRSTTRVFQAKTEGVPTLYDIFFGDYKASDCIQHTPYGDIIASDENLQSADTMIKPSPKMYKYIKNAMKELETKYDFILYDTMPHTGILLGNVLNCVDYAICPCICDAFGIQGLMDFYEVIQEYQEDNTNLELLGLLIVKYKGRQSLTKDIEDNLLPMYAQQMNTKIFETRIRESVKLQEAQAISKSIYDHAASSTVAQDYKQLTNEIIDILKEKGVL